MLFDFSCCSEIDRGVREWCRQSEAAELSYHVTFPVGLIRASCRLPRVQKEELTTPVATSCGLLFHRFFIDVPHVSTVAALKPTWVCNAETVLGTPKTQLRRARPRIWLFALNRHHVSFNCGCCGWQELQLLALTSPMHQAKLTVSPPMVIRRPCCDAQVVFGQRCYHAFDDETHLCGQLTAAVRQLSAQCVESGGRKGGTYQTKGAGPKRGSYRFTFLAFEALPRPPPLLLPAGCAFGRFCRPKQQKPLMKVC